MRGAHPDRNIRLLFGYWFLQDFQLWIPVWIVFLTIERGFSLTQVTMAEGLYLVGVLILEVPTGAVADRWGRSKSMALGAFLLGGAVLIFAFTTSFAILMASFLLWSVAHALMSGADNALLFDTLKASGRESEYEKVAGRGIAAHWGGAGVATLLGGPVAAFTDVRMTIFIGAATCVAASLIALSLWEAPRAREDGPKESYFGGIRAAFGEAWQVVDVRILILLAGTAFAALEAVHYLIQPYLIDRDIAVGTVFSLLQVPLLFAGLVGALLAGRIVTTAASTRTFLLVPVLGASCYALLAGLPGLAAYAAFPLMIALGSLVEPLTTGYVNRRIGSERRATVLSIQSMIRSLVLAVLAPGLGFATDHWGIGEAFAIGGALALISGIAFGIPLLLRGRKVQFEPPMPSELREAAG
jgi:MFS family permease